MPNDTATVFSPASVANVACGYDILGFAVKKLGDVVHVKLNGTSETRIIDIKGDNGKLPTEIYKNTCSVSILAYLKHYNINEGVDIVLEKNLPLSSGLGSSSSSSVAGAVAVNALFKKASEKIELLPFVIEGEVVASGTSHADNVAPALLGGFCYVRDGSKKDVFRLPFIHDLHIILVTPECEINTKQSRKLIPNVIPLEDVKKQSANLGSFIHALHTKDMERLKTSMEDFIAEPYRKSMIPHYVEYKEVIQSSGNDVIACNISGSGPTIFTLVGSQNGAEKLLQLTKEFYLSKKLFFKAHLTEIDNEGAKIISH